MSSIQKAVKCFFKQYLWLEAGEFGVEAVHPKASWLVEATRAFIRLSASTLILPHCSHKPCKMLLTKLC